jgi:subtilisin family serine protease
VPGPPIPRLRATAGPRPPPTHAEDGIREPLDPLEFVGLSGLMALTRGRADLVVGLVDGPVALDHPDLATGHVRKLPGTIQACRDAKSAPCRHGTFIAGILAARRGARAPAIGPDCTLLVRPVFSEAAPVSDMPSATPGELAEAIVDCVDAGAQILNLSAALAHGSFGANRDLKEALQYTVRREVLVVAAAGNQGAVAGSAITRHPWVISVAAYSRAGLLMAQSNLGRSIGIGGLGGPGDGVVSLAPEGESAVAAGTSIAAPFVTGAAALLMSLFPSAAAAEVKSALLSAPAGRRTTVTPPLLDAWGAYEVLARGRARRAMP